MHKEILTKEQIELLPLIKELGKDFGLIGGTAIALHIGHRQSIDFDLAIDKELDNNKIRRKILKFGRIEKVLVDNETEYTIAINGVKMTFIHYPFKIGFFKKFDDIIKLPDMLSLAAMKAYSLGRRAKWKDYVDLYFVIKNHFNVKKISEKAKKIFGNEFNEKIFRSQLAYFKDIDYSEKIIYLENFKTDEKIIKRELINFSLN